MIEFHKAIDDRAVFANIACKLLYQKYNGQFSSVTFQNELRILRSYFEEYVRNIYEVIHDEIPLFAWADYLRYGYDKDQWCDDTELTEEQYVKIIFDACKKYYS